MNRKRRVERLTARLAAKQSPLLQSDDDVGDARMAATFAEWAASGWFANEPTNPRRPGRLPAGDCG